MKTVIQMNEDAKTQGSLIKYKAKDLKIEFPKNDKLTEKEMTRSQNAISNHGIALENNRTMINKKAIPTLLCTDQKGANKFYGKLSESDKYKDGDKQYASTSSVVKEISEKIQEPRDSLTREQLKYNETCINSFRDADRLENERSIEEARIRKELPKLGPKIMKENGITTCEVTGEAFDNDAHAHHLERKADNPRRALDPSNIKMVKEKVHVKIHSENAEGEEGFKKFVEDYKKAKT